LPLSGPSAAETADQTQSQDFSKLLNQSYSQNFAGQSSILGNLTSVLNPIAEAGPDQEGFNASEKAALTGGAINTNAQNYKNASTVVAEGNAGAGGNTYAPSGGQGQEAATIASNAAQNTSNTENQITEADYAQGRQNFQGAVGGLENVAQQYNPNATAGEATTAGGQAFSESSNINQQDNAWMGDLTGLVGGLGGAALGAYGRSAKNTGN
jgi:hypothetical protein